MSILTFIQSIITGIFIILSGYSYGFYLTITNGRNDGFYAATKWWARTILFLCRIKVIINHIDEFPKQAIYIANHVSLADTPVMIHILPSKTRFMYKSDLDNAPGIGAVLRRSPYISVHRKSIRKSAESIMEARKALDSGDSIMLFPEGTWSEKAGDLLKFKQGAFSLAKYSNIPIIPIVITGTELIIPKHTIFIYSGEVQITIYPQIYPQDFATEEEMSHACKQIILNHLQSIYH